MKLNSETKRKMREMKAEPLFDALLNEDDFNYDLTAGERVAIAIGISHANYIEHQVNLLKSRAKFRYPNADVRLIDFDENRNISRAKIAEYASCSFIEHGDNLIIEGFAGTGKTYLACAIGVAACRHLIKSKYIRIPDLKEEFLRAKLKPKGTYNLKKRYGCYGLLIVDEWMLDNVSEDFRAFLFEIFELRYKKCSIILCTQAKVEDWHVKLGGDTKAEAIIDRIVYNTTNIQIGDVNMRKKIK